MRKIQQKKIFELLGTLSEINLDIERLISRGDTESVIQVLAECQDFAVQIGNNIESIEGEDTQTVSLLEGYCDELYNLNVDLNNGNSGSIFIKRIKKTLVQITNSVRTELRPNRIEVVFIPYKRAMSDSLESIWQTALQDPQCDTYIIPVPYYDRLPGKALGPMHYEGDLYPSDLHITDWREYDFVARHPDIIFTHCSYDDESSVTSLHPDFYSKRLRDLTDLLVYVPYYVCLDDVAEIMCESWGIMYSDRVIVQSEKIRQTYIHVLKRLEKEHNCKGFFGKPEDKFIALGSPKFDAVLNIKSDDFMLPDAWRDLIVAPSGNKKKVILYNNAITIALRSAGSNLEKIRFVLDVFRKCNDVILWWRPHPLIEATYQSMHPQLQIEYTKIINDYKYEGWGIYDDTPDLHRAIAFSDAYYGDWSSLVPLYLATGNPVMISNVDIISRALPPRLEYVYAVGESLWASVSSLGAVFSIDESCYELSYMGSFPGILDSQGAAEQWLYGKAVEHSGKVYYPPFSAKEIAVWSLDDAVFNKIPYERYIGSKEDDSAFQGAVAHKDYVFFTPYLYPAITQMNTLTHEITYHSDWVNPLKALISDEQDAFFITPLVVEDSIFLAACGANAVVEFNMDTCASIVHEVGDPGYCYNGICFDGEDFWLSPRHNTPVVKWNPRKGVIKVFSDLCRGNTASRFCFTPAIFCAGYVWLLPFAADHAHKIEVSTNTVSYSDEFNAPLFDEWNTGNVAKYSFAYVIRDNIYAYCEKTSTLIEYHCLTGERKESTVKYSPEMAPELKQLFIKQFHMTPEMGTVQSCNYYESRLTTLADYITVIHQDDDSIWASALKDRRKEVISTISINNDGKSGQAIYDYAKSCVFEGSKT